MPESPRTGRLELLTLPRAGQPRQVRVYLPPGYPEHRERYPVIYMFDGQNLFDDRTATRGMGWQIHTTVDRMTSEDPSLATVVVGIDSPAEGAARVGELSLGEWQFPTAEVMPELGAVVDIHGSGEVTTDFLVHTVKPMIEDGFNVSTDRTRVAVGGSSLGGFMSLHAMALHPDVFGVVLAFSPAVFDRPMRGDLLRAIIRQSRHESPTRVYLDMGGSEELPYYGDVVSALEPLAEAVTASGHATPIRLVFPTHGHDERSWERRFEGAIRWGLHNGPVPRAD